MCNFFKNDSRNPDHFHKTFYPSGTMALGEGAPEGGAKAGFARREVPQTTDSRPRGRFFFAAFLPVKTSGGFRSGGKNGIMAENEVSQCEKMEPYPL